MTQAREVSRDTYYAIQDKAHDLFTAIHDAMDAIRRTAPDVQTDEWSDLHALSKIAGAASELAHSFALEAPRADDIPVPCSGDVPVPFTAATRDDQDAACALTDDSPVPFMPTMKTMTLGYER